MTIYDLYQQLKNKFADRSDPDRWWPIYHGVTTPQQFERVITNVLVQNSSWTAVENAVHALHSHQLLTAQSLVDADLALIATCIRPTGLQKQKAQRLQTVGAFVLYQFKTEARFCEQVTREQLLDLPGIGNETADRILLYSCSRLAWPVDTYCFRVLAHHQVIEEIPVKKKQKDTLAINIKQMVEQRMPADLQDWQRLHALMQLEGTQLPKVRTS